MKPSLSRRLEGTRDLLGLHRQDPELLPVLLESAARGTSQGRFDLLLAGPGETLTLTAEGRLEGHGQGGADSDFLAALDAWARDTVAVQPPEGLPFVGGWFLYLGYELAGQVEPSLQLRRPVGQVCAMATRMRGAVVVDHIEASTWVLAEPGEEGLFRSLCALAEAGRSEAAPDAVAPPEEAATTAVMTEEAPERYLDAVERAKRYIVDGDIFQANLARTWEGELAPDTDPADIYAQLRRANPGPFAGLARMPGLAVISSSPERLVLTDGDTVQTRPIAGTRPRGADADADRDLSRELLAHPKERAEHVMLIDLERNDLGRVCRPGSVEVDEMMVIESYAHVHHIVSNVRGSLRPETTRGDVIRATFPGGTITGCPKVRCMEIIAELEASPRGAYTGSMGYLSSHGRMDLNILIRTLSVRDRHVSLKAGAGIVADSVPQRELEETRDKARGLLRALGAAD